MYDAPKGTALVLANFTYERIRDLEISLPVSRTVRYVRSLTRGPLQFEQRQEPTGAYRYCVDCKLDLELTDILLFE